MSNAIVHNGGNNLPDYWDNKQRVRKLFASKLNDEEWQIFLAYGMTYNANPYIGEIIPIPFINRKTGERKLTFILTRDYRVKIARMQPEYNGHRAACVYEKDEFSYDSGTGKLHHPIDPRQDRGKLIGAYCIGWLHGVDHPFFVYRKFSEYNKKENLWLTKPDTMMEKVPESHLLKKMFPIIFNGTYDEAELPTPKNGIIEEGKKTRSFPRSAPRENGKKQEQSMSAYELRKSVLLNKMEEYFKGKEGGSDLEEAFFYGLGIDIHDASGISEDNIDLVETAFDRMVENGNDNI